jgi:hypothetical protein
LASFHPTERFSIALHARFGDPIEQLNDDPARFIAGRTYRRGSSRARIFKTEDEHVQPPFYRAANVLFGW